MREGETTHGNGHGIARRQRRRRLRPSELIRVLWGRLRSTRARRQRGGNESGVSENTAGLDGSSDQGACGCCGLLSRKESSARPERRLALLVVAAGSEKEKDKLDLELGFDLIVKEMFEFS